MDRSGMVMKQIVLLFLFGLLLGCRTRSAVTPTPALPTEESNTAAPTPTLAAIQPTNTALPTATASPIAAVTATSTPTREEAQGLEERVSFDPGATSATIEQAVVRGTTNRYLVGAQAGQTMHVEISSLEDNAVFHVLAPDGDQVEGMATEGVTAWEQVLAQSGDYTIVVSSTRGNATYRMELAIPPVASPEPTRIRFEPGMAATTVAGHIEAGGRAQYVLSAVEDQDMSVYVQTPGEPVVVGVRGADGTVFLPLEAQRTGLRIVALPATMDYFIEVVSTGAETDFQLDVGASPLADLPERIELGDGTSTVSGTLDMGGDLESYILQGGEGQTITVEALPAEAPLSVYLQSEDGVDFYYAVEGLLVANLSRTLDYVLTVSTPNAAGVTDYELRIEIDS